jgi:hypothetical protein
VHGSSTDLVSDLESAGTKLSHHPPPDLVSWRPALEQEVLKSRDVCCANYSVDTILW